MKFNTKAEHVRRVFWVSAIICGILIVGFAFRVLKSSSSAFVKLSGAASSPPSVSVIEPFRLPADATVEIEGVSHKLAPNSIHEYPRLTVPAKSTIPIHLQFKPNDIVEVTVLDGGNLDNKSIFQSQVAGANGSVDFHFRVKALPGAYRVAVVRNGQRSVFNFWVGPDLPGRVSSQ